MSESRVAALVAEFTPLNHRRSHADPPLTVLELQRWGELRDLLAYELGHTPPIGKAERPLRVPTQLKVRYGDVGERSGNLHNLSEGGLFVETNAPVAAGTRLDLQIDPGNAGEMIALEGEVIWVRELPNMDGPAGFGVALRDLEADEFAAIGDLVVAALEALARG